MNRMNYFWSLSFFMRKIIIISVFILLGSSVVRAQEPDPFIQSKVNQVSQDTMVKYLHEFENLGIKDIYSQALINTADWIESKYLAFGYTDIQRDTFYYGGQTLYNLVITKQGTTYPDKFLIIDGHYDTRNGPGTNDNGTGTVILLEIARLMEGIDHEVSIRFIHFSAEEEGLVGSNHYVNNVSGPQNHDIKLVFNIDEVGGVNGMVNDILVCERDESFPSGNNAASWAYTDTLANLTSLYTSLEPEISYAYGSDYVPFQLNGNIITGYFEYNYSPYPHTIFDSLSKLDTNYVFEIAKGSLAAALYFSVTSGSSTNVVTYGEKGNLVRISHDTDHHYLKVLNPKNIEDLAFLLFDTRGRLIQTGKIKPESQSIITTMDLQPGIYLYKVFDKNHSTLNTGKLIF